MSVKHRTISGPLFPNFAAGAAGMFHILNKRGELPRNLPGWHTVAEEVQDLRVPRREAERDAEEHRLVRAVGD
ncbi:hypothetical protein AKJ37_06845 [candidate division MSBL1 archaeon SCGC-AAA259I09]|uniref:Uncharacterized protein n=1 Tax=candidate division MSBL1 archaeon SCGC-AAA259I09 TaxID=1698267 RepID=A0A133UMS4_9EURY|nr:hypothetical protein AKJ37_06845 [candidate division MSBL1 archaeon SCGC-AAA259I09]